MKTINLDLAQAELLSQYEDFISSSTELATKSELFRFNVDNNVATLMTEVGENKYCVITKTLNYNQFGIKSLSSDTKTLYQVI